MDEVMVDATVPEIRVDTAAPAPSVGRRRVATRATAEAMIIRRRRVISQE
jgi:hypothetical protein